MPSGLSFPALPEPVHLSEAEEHYLGLLAVRALKNQCRGLPEEDENEQPHPSAPVAKAGVFVTLFHHGELRGCLGTAEGREPLCLSVPRLARAAASKDRRFEPVEEGELGAMEVEVTILGGLTALPADTAVLLAGLKPEIHGVYIRLGGRSGLYLPQVARRLGWGPTELLEQVCLKARLSKSAWQLPGRSLFAFTARSFCVSDLNAILLEGERPPDGR